jgi:nuclear transport factor 2 (NTF2) superfamily protein
MKEFCKYELIDCIWDNMAKYYRKKAKNYIKTFLTRKLNSEKLYQT